MENNQKINLLLVEDDHNLGNLLKEYLEEKEYIVTLAADGKEGLKKFKNGLFDICVLDVMMPIMDGFTLAKEIRILNHDVPLIFLTAKAMKEDAIEGFNAGADDYMIKPFSTEEFLLRLKAILRRTSSKSMFNSELKEFQIGQYHFDFDHQTLTFKDESMRLTTREAQLLKLFCLNQNEVLDRNYALKTIWQDDNYFNGRSMDVYITKLRKYLKNDPEIEIINVHGKGFKMLVPQVVNK
ncbi:MAG: response regulator transcription factor [Bacteroidota bacterium]|jgi:two-component system OmpR family response regulator